MVLLVALAGFPGCKEAILTAPDSATLQVTVNPTVIPLGGQASITVTGFKASGTPLPDGTWIFFTTTIGTVESKKETSNGVAEVVLHSNDNRSGIAIITVTSGNAKTIPEEITITIGSAALSSLSISSDLSVLPKNGGTVTVRVTAYDETLNPLPNIPVIFTTTNGRLDSAGNAVMTNANGVATDRLHCQGSATISASSGDIIAPSLTISVESNENPVAVFEVSPRAPKIGDDVFFNGSASSDSDGSIVSYQWDFGDGHRASGVTAQHQYSQMGEFSVVLVVQDNVGNQGSSGKSVAVTNGTLPVASFIYSPDKPGINETIHFNAAASTDSDGTIDAYDWDFGDGTTSAGVTVTHKYTAKATYRILLKVTDNHGNTATTNKDLAIGGSQAPEAQFVFSPSAPKENETIHFNASTSKDIDGTITAYFWDFGDGTTGTGMTSSHSYSHKGTYTVVLRVTDNDGNTGNTSKTVTVSTGTSPTATFQFSPTNPYTTTDVYFNASGSTDADGTIVNFGWDFGDGSTGSGERTSHRYTRAGRYKVILTVTDNDGNKTNGTADIDVTSALPPTADFLFNLNPGLAVSFNASASSATNGTIVSYSWDFGDATQETTSNPTINHIYISVGSYLVVLTVTDSNGNTGSTNKSVTVN